MFLKKLKSVCKNCTESSIKVYMRNIKRLYNLVERKTEDIPDNGKWVKEKKVFDAYTKLPLSQKRHLSVGGHKAAQAYGMKESVWEKEMFKTSSQYKEERSKNKKSETEEKLWVKDGYKAIKKASTEQLKRIKSVFESEASIPNLYKYQVYLLFKMFSEIPFRNGFSSLELTDKKTNNYISIPKRGPGKIVVRKHKNVKSMGETEVKLSRGVTTALRKFKKYRDDLDLSHDFLFSNRQGKPLTRDALSKIMHRHTKILLNKSFGSRLIRVMAATQQKDIISKAQEFSTSMLHSQKQSQEYIRK